MTRKQIERLNEGTLRTIYNNIIVTKNLVNIQRVKGQDLNIVDTDEYTYILTYSFPCQDLSLAGKRAGMKDNSTRSGMLWEVERILDECKELGNLPEVLLMENVSQVHGEGNVDSFNKWCDKLESLGYKNYFKDLIATDYGIPQTRNRCFMVSVLGNYSYSFPEPIPLKLKLKDMLEDNVNEKYFLSDKQIKEIQNWKAYEKPLEHRKDEVCGTLTTRSGEYTSSMKLTAIPIKNATKKGYLEATIGDGIDISSRMEHHRGTVQKNKAQTLTTTCDVGVIGTYQYGKSDTFMHGKDRLQIGKSVSDTLQTNPKEGVVVLGNYMKSGHNASRIVDSEASAPTVMENHGTITATLTSDLRIRKLTPKECFRLMGVKDEDFERCSKNQSNASLYHLAGDSIVVNVLMKIFKEMIV